VVRIKASIENLNGRLDDAGRQIAQQKKTFGKNSQVGQQTTNMVEQLKEEFGQAAGGFKDILKQRTDVMKETTDRKRQIYGADDDVPVLNLENMPPVYGESSSSMGAMGFPTLDLTSGMATGEPTSSGSQLPRPREYRQSYRFSCTIVTVFSCFHLLLHDIDGTASFDNGMRLRKTTSDPMSSSPYGASNYYGRQDSTPMTPYDIQRMEEESGQDQMMQLIPDQDYLRERADAMEQVETNIVELGTIFNKLAVMVNEHKEMVHRVEDNVDDVNATINFSLNTLTDTLANLQSNRALFLKVFSVLVIFIITFIIFAA
jgi:syntaxin 5